MRPSTALVSVFVKYYFNALLTKTLFSLPFQPELNITVNNITAAGQYLGSFRKFASKRNKDNGLPEHYDHAALLSRWGTWSYDTNMWSAEKCPVTSQHGRALRFSHFVPEKRLCELRQVKLGAAKVRWLKLFSHVSDASVASIPAILMVRSALVFLTELQKNIVLTVYLVPGRHISFFFYEGSGGKKGNITCIYVWCSICFCIFTSIYFYFFSCLFMILLGEYLERL